MIQLFVLIKRYPRNCDMNMKICIYYRQTFIKVKCFILSPRADSGTKKSGSGRVFKEKSRKIQALKSPNQVQFLR